MARLFIKLGLSLTVGIFFYFNNLAVAKTGDIVKPGITAPPRARTPTEIAKDVAAQLEIKGQQNLHLEHMHKRSHNPCLQLKSDRLCIQDSREHVEGVLKSLSAEESKSLLVFYQKVIDYEGNPQQIASHFVALLPLAVNLSLGPESSKVSIAPTPLTRQQLKKQIGDISQETRSFQELFQTPAGYLEQLQIWNSEKYPVSFLIWPDEQQSENSVVIGFILFY